MTVPVEMFVFDAIYIENCRGSVLQNVDVEQLGHRGRWLRDLPASAHVWFIEPIFDDATYLRVDLPSRPEAKDVFNRLTDARGTQHDTYDPPKLWPIHPKTTESPFGFPVPSWWPEIGSAGVVWLAQKPETLGECVTRNVSGTMVILRGRRVYAHAWWREYVGGCGG